MGELINALKKVMQAKQAANIAKRLEAAKEEAAQLDPINKKIPPNDNLVTNNPREVKSLGDAVNDAHSNAAASDLDLATFDLNSRYNSTLDRSDSQMLQNVIREELKRRAIIREQIPSAEGYYQTVPVESAFDDISRLKNNPEEYYFGVKADNDPKNRSYGAQPTPPPKQGPEKPK